MRGTTRRHTAAAAMALWALTAAACSSVGTYREVVEVDLPRGYAATQAAMTDLNYEITERSRSGTEARVLARTPDKAPVRVDLEAAGKHLTEFRVRAGMLRNNDQGQAILTRIKSRF